jgi:hypothetical protein
VIFRIFIKLVRLLGMLEQITLYSISSVFFHNALSLGSWEVSKPFNNTFVLFCFCFYFIFVFSTTRYHFYDFFHNVSAT